MPRIRINLRDVEELEDLDEVIEDFEELENQHKRARPRDRADNRKPVRHEMLERKREERRKNREFARYVREQRYQ